jgi:hypothetical protein
MGSEFHVVAYVLIGNLSPFQNMRWPPDEEAQAE